MIYKIRNRKKKKENIGKHLFIIGMLFFPMFWFLVFWLYVSLDSILMAFKVYEGFGKYSWSLQNFRDMFYEFSLPDSTMRISLRNTLLFFPENI